MWVPSDRAHRHSVSPPTALRLQERLPLVVEVQVPRWVAAPPSPPVPDAPAEVARPRLEVADRPAGPRQWMVPVGGSGGSEKTDPPPPRLSMRFLLAAKAAMAKGWETVTAPSLVKTSAGRPLCPYEKPKPHQAMPRPSCCQRLPMMPARCPGEAVSGRCCCCEQRGSPALSLGQIQKRPAKTVAVPAPSLRPPHPWMTRLALPGNLKMPTVPSTLPTTTRNEQLGHSWPVTLAGTAPAAMPTRRKTSATPLRVLAAAHTLDLKRTLTSGVEAGAQRGQLQPLPLPPWRRLGDQQPNACAGALCVSVGWRHDDDHCCYQWLLRHGHHHRCHPRHSCHMSYRRQHYHRHHHQRWTPTRPRSDMQPKRWLLALESAPGQATGGVQQAACRRMREQPEEGKRGSAPSCPRRRMIGAQRQSGCAGATSGAGA